MGRKAKTGILISNLKFYRQNSGLTQKQVAEALHIERTTYTYYENGKTLPNVITLKKLAEIYNVPVDCLMPSESNKPMEVGDSDFSSPQKEENAQQAAARKTSNEKIYCLSNDEQSLIINYRILPGEVKREVFENLKQLTEKYKDEMT